VSTSPPLQESVVEKLTFFYPKTEYAEIRVACKNARRRVAFLLAILIFNSVKD
jgi:hypothetical protein